MSYCHYKNKIDDGDTVVVYLSPKQMYPVKVQRGEVFQTRFGAIRLDQLIGKNYGCRIECSKGFVHILDMTPELWTLTLPHRTQILYGPDISLILMHLQLKSGSVVVEAGTGSGSLSHSIARTIAPNGRLFTFDFHEERVQTAREEFRQHGIQEIVNIQHRDVCQDGFLTDEIKQTTKHVDAVFLDLPHPWEAIHSAQRILKNGGRICCFSPCIEQVQRSCQQLSKLNFLDIETFECVLRPYEVRNVSLKDLTKFFPNNSSTNSNNTNNNQNSSNKTNLKLEGEDSVNNNDNLDHSKNSVQSSNSLELSTKKIRFENQTRNNCSTQSNEIEYWVTYMNAEVPGHTGFLTFGTNFQFETSINHQEFENSPKNHTEDHQKDS